MVFLEDYPRKLTITNITFAKYKIWTTKITNTIYAAKVLSTTNN